MDDRVTLGGMATREYVGVSESDPLRGTVDLMVDRGVDCAVVLSGSEPVGVVRALDVLAHVADDTVLDDQPVSAVMADLPPVLPATHTVADALTAMSETDASVVLVSAVDDGGLVGTVEVRDLVAAEVSRPPDARDRDWSPARESEVGVGYSEQSICEACGAFTQELVSYNGQLLCPDCRSV